MWKYKVPNIAKAILERHMVVEHILPYSKTCIKWVQRFGTDTGINKQTMKQNWVLKQNKVHMPNYFNQTRLAEQS